MRKFIFFALFSMPLAAQISGGGSTAPIPCVGSPGDTSANLGQQCYTSSAVYSCIGTITGYKCNVEGDWLLIGPGASGPPSGAASGVLSGNYPSPGFANSVAIPGSPTTTNPANTDNSTKISTTHFVRALLAALNPATAVAASTVTILPDSPTYNNGAGTLTATVKAALVIDDYTVLLNDRLLINNQASAAQNGVYTCTTLGSASVYYVLTRATDFNTVSTINNAGVIPVTNGTVNNGTTWALDAAIVTLGTSPINYDQTNSQPPVITTVNGVACTAGSVSCSPYEFKAGGTDLSLQSPVNFRASGSASGITLGISNPGGNGDVLYTLGGAVTGIPTTNQNLRTIGAVLTPTALTACVYVPFAGTINAFHAVAGDGATADTVLVKVETQPTFATFISTGVSGASDISNGGEQLTSVLGLVDSTLTSWSKTVTAGTTVCLVGSTFSVGTSVNANVTIAAN